MLVKVQLPNVLSQARISIFKGGAPKVMAATLVPVP